jgi:hypothetical protein
MLKMEISKFYTRRKVSWFCYNSNIYCIKCYDIILKPKRYQTNYYNNNYLAYQLFTRYYLSLLKQYMGDSG